MLEKGFGEMNWSSGEVATVAKMKKQRKEKEMKRKREVALASSENLPSLLDIKPKRTEKKRKNTEDSHTAAAEEAHSILANVVCRKKKERSKASSTDINACHGDQGNLCYQDKSSIKKRKKENDKTKKKKRHVYFEYQSMQSNQSCGGDALYEHVTMCKYKDGKIFGKRFTREEDEILKTAILDFIKEKGWEEKEGITKVLNSNKHREAYQCWRDIQSWLPDRPRAALRHRAHRLLDDGTHLGRWSREEVKVLSRLMGEHGYQWKNISTLMSRSGQAISEKWRLLRRPWRTGPWTREELQQLYELVHTQLQSKTAEKSKEDCNSLRDNISWDKIADAIGTRRHSSCCLKWYCNLSSTMVNDGLWASRDDFLLLESLLKSGACIEEEVEWDRLISHRSGQTCLVRWKQMVKHLGETRTRGFLENLDGLVQRYAPDLIGPMYDEL